MNPFAKLLIDYMDRIRISDAELAGKVGVRRQTIYRWRTGESRAPDIVRMCCAVPGPWV